jgi:hypothetical protein
MIKIPRMQRGENQEFESLINEEALLFAKYLRNERKEWIPRIAELKSILMPKSRTLREEKGYLSIKRETSA